MTPDFAVELIKSMLQQGVVLAGPLLGVALATGLAVSLFQAVTSIHEQTLAFVPKVLAIAGLGVVLLPWLLRSLVEFTTQVFSRIPQMVH
jgi:flagellar biosynthetic protein FliQ